MSLSGPMAGVALIGPLRGSGFRISVALDRVYSGIWTNAQISISAFFLSLFLLLIFGIFTFEFEQYCLWRLYHA